MKKEYYLWGLILGLVAWFATLACFPVATVSPPTGNRACYDNTGKTTPCPGQTMCYTPSGQAVPCGT